MSTIKESIEVNVPLRVAYDQWTQFEEFPEFMEGVERVTQIDDTTLEWVAKIRGLRKQWRAKITHQIPDQRITWRSMEGAPNAGTVRFEPINDRTTRVSLEMEVEPQGPAESVGTAVGVPERQVSGDLERFKTFIEARGEETGAWRGKVEGGAARRS